MFGIGLPEMILIMALALIVVGPDKLPDLARSLAKTILDLKKTAENLKDSLNEEGNPLDEIKPDLEEAAKSLKSNLLDPLPSTHDTDKKDKGSPADNAALAYKELMKRTSGAKAEETTPQAEPPADSTPAPPGDDSPREKPSENHSQSG